MYTLSTECMIGESEYDDSLEYEYNSGVFLLSDPVSCGGTLAAVNVSGLCTLSGMTNMTVELRLLVFEQTSVGYSRKFGRSVTAKCYHSTNDSGSNYTTDSVNGENLDVPVSCGNFLGIRFNATCAETKCYFLPAAVNVTGKQLMYFPARPGPMQVLDKNAVRFMPDATLLFSANIVNISGEIHQHVIYTCMPTLYVSLTVYLHVIFCYRQLHHEEEPREKHYCCRSRSHNSPVVCVSGYCLTVCVLHEKENKEKDHLGSSKFHCQAYHPF